jgi:hypothetical protein
MKYRGIAWPLFAEAWAELLLCTIMLRSPFRQNFMRRSANTRIKANPDMEIINVLLQEISRASSHHVKSMTCLERSLAAQRTLGRRGFATTIRYGIYKAYKNQAALEAHAWLEFQGDAITTTSESFVPMK